MHLVLLLVLCVLFSCPAQAASEVSPAYMKMLLIPPLEGNEALSVQFVPDEALCRKAYGDDWNRRCLAAPGQDGALARGVRLLPDLPGEWRWNGSSTLEFRPKEMWPQATSCTVRLDRLLLPSRIRLNSEKIDFATPPLASLGIHGTMWVDPDLHGERAVSFDVTFTTPPDRALVERDTVLQIGEGMLGKTEFVWSGDGRACLIRARIVTMPEKQTTAILRLPGVAGKVIREGTGWKVQERTAMQQVTVPGLSSLFRIQEARLEPVRNASLAGEYHLTLKTSLLIRPDTVLKAMTALQLPRSLQPDAAEATPWTRAPIIDEEVLNRSTKVKVESLQPADQPAETLRFKVAVEPDAYLFLDLPGGFGPSQDLPLQRSWREVFHASPFGVELDFLQPGNVLVLGGEQKLDLYASGLSAIHWRASRVLNPFLGFLAMQSSPFADSNMLLDALGDACEGDIPLQRTAPGGPQFTVLDMAPLLQDGRGLMQIQLSGMDGDRKVAEAVRLVLITDLGLVAKRNANGTRDVFVCSLKEGNPVRGASVSILGSNGLPVAEAVTDADGRAMLPSVSGMEREKTPVAIIARRDHDMAWLPLNDFSRVVDYSRFPIQGQTGSEDGINAYVFSERGMFRPGETVHFGVIIRRGDWKALPSGLPFVAELRDASERTIMQRQFSVGPDGLAELSWHSSEGAAAGRYRLDIQMPDPNGVPEVLGSGAVRLEEFQPDTLSIAAQVVPDPGKGWISSADAVARIDLKNLYGTPAGNRRLRGQLSVSPARLTFPGYEDFTFHDAMPYRGSALRLDLAEVRTDAEGRAELPLPLERLRGGTLACSLLIEGFEPGGGRAVTMRQSFLVSPLRAILGYRPSGAGCNLEFIPEGSASQLEFVALDSSLHRTDPGKLSFSVAERRSVTSLVTDSEGRYRYDETPVEREVSVTEQTFDDEGNLVWSIPTARPGEYLLSVRDASGQVMARIPFVVAGNDDLRPALKDRLPSGTLRLRTDRVDYAPGEKVRLLLSAPYDGIGLITLERDSVVAWRWFHAQAGNSVQEIDIPSNFEGRAYVNVSLARSISSSESFIQPHSCAVTPITVNGSARNMGLQLAVPKSRVAPGSAVAVALSARRPGKAILFAVDEGVLQLTAFATPDPLRYLLEDRALEVETLQMFDLLMPEHGRYHIPAYGGDMEKTGGRFHNPFKRKGEPPLSWWSGIVDIGPEARTFSIPVPGYYNGSVRIMAVAVSPDMTGNAEAAALIQGAVVLTPQLPLLAAPGDSFDASLAVANTTDRDMTFRLTAEMDSALHPAVPLPETIAVAAGEEQQVPLRIQVGDEPGNATVRFAVTDSDGRETVRSASLSVRPASALRESLQVGTASSSMRIETGRELYPWSARGSASVSVLPLPALRGLVRYLDSYPYTCTEQRISRAMPYALLMNSPDLLADAGSRPEDILKRSRQYVDEAIQGIQQGLNWNGIALWPGGQADLLVTAYAADFLLTMRESGAALPGGLLESVCNALERALDRIPESLEDGRAQAYGLWVLTREGRITTRSLEQLVRQLEERIPGWQEDVTSSLLAGSCAIMRMHDDANRLVDLYQTPGNAFRQQDLLDALGVQSLRASVLARHFPAKIAQERSVLAQELLDTINHGGYVSLSSALGIRALLDLGQGLESRSLSQVGLRCTAMQPGFDSIPAVAQEHSGMLTLFQPGCAAYALDMPEQGPELYWEVSEQGFDRRPPSEALMQGLEVSRVYLDAEGLPAQTVQQGDMITVRITARSHGAPVSDVALVDLLPGGFEHVLSETPDMTEAGDGNMDRREDRMLFFLSLDTESHSVSYKIRAVNRGSFALPPVQAEAMYNRSLRAHSQAGVIEVK